MLRMFLKPEQSLLKEHGAPRLNRQHLFGRVAVSPLFSHPLGDPRHDKSSLHLPCF